MRFGITTNRAEGIRRFLDRGWRLFFDDETDELLPQVQDVEPDAAVLKVLHKTIDAVSTMTEDLRFNTAISQMMVFVNEMSQAAVRPRSVLEKFVVLMGPYAPHWAEEVWRRLGHHDTLTYETWPTADPRYLVEDTITVVVQVNGKVRDQIEIAADAEQDLVLEQALGAQRIQQWLEGKQIVKQIYVPGKLVNLVVK